MHHHAIKEAVDAVRCFHEKHKVPNLSCDIHCSAFEYRFLVKQLSDEAKATLKTVRDYNDELQQKEIMIWRNALVVEEFCELLKALHRGSKVEIAKEIADCLYVLIGMAIQFNIPIVDVFDKVQEANMSKEGTFAGKYKDVMYTPPNLEGI